jgi:hypothetical protein
VGSPQRDTLNGGDGDDELLAGGGNDYLTGALGADMLSGGDGVDAVSYGGNEPLRLSIGDGANDGAAGEGDDIRGDVEGLTGGFGSDVLIGNDESNRLIAYGGQDVLRGAGGRDLLIGWGDGDELDPGAGADRVRAGRRDRVLLRDGERDRLNCGSTTPSIEADVFDTLLTCAPRVRLVRLRRVRATGALRVLARCPSGSTVPCEGRIWIERVRGRRISRRVHCGPIEPGGRASITIRLTGRPRPGSPICASAHTRRNDGSQNSTSTASTYICLPR